MKTKLVTVLVLMITFGCVDRVFFDIKIPDTYGISIDGFISDQPGPYQVNVFRTFDIESKENLKSGVTARVTLLDGEENSEVLTQGTSGIYATAAHGMQGKIGGVYKIKVELNDGRVYESTPDTLFAGGTLNDARYDFVPRQAAHGIQYDIALIAQTSTTADLARVHFMWRNHVTFKSRTQPELELGPPPGPCYRIDEEGRCNFVHLCSGWKNLGTDYAPNLTKVGECTCCTCWYDAYNHSPVLNDDLTSIDGKYNDILIDRVPMNGWNMMYKIRLEASVQSLSQQAHRYWRGVKNQYTAVSNVFQPITGKIPGNISQTGGQQSPAYGLFYATSISSKYFYIQREDVSPDMIAKHNPKAGYLPCFNLYPNASTTQPSFWEE